MNNLNSNDKFYFNSNDYKTNNNIFNQNNNIFSNLNQSKIFLII